MAREWMTFLYTYPESSVSHDCCVVDACSFPVVNAHGEIIIKGTRALSASP